MKKLIFLVGIAALSYAANGSINSQAEPSKTFKQQQNKVSSDCSHLSQQEQQFASQLSIMHRTMFCRHFSVSQRVEAMTLVSSEVEKLTGQKSTLTPDEAVELIMKNARDDQPNKSGSEPQQQTQPQGQGQQQQQNPYGNYSYPSSSNSGSSSNPYSNY